MSSTWLLMLLYETMNVNVAFGIGFGGAFLLAQMALAVLFRSRLSWVQSGGLVAMTAGMLMLGLGGAS